MRTTSIDLPAKLAAVAAAATFVAVALASAAAWAQTKPAAPPTPAPSAQPAPAPTNPGSTSAPSPSASPSASQQDGTPQNSLGMPIDPALLNTLPELKGVVSWNLLAQVKATQKDKRVIPEFATAVRALDKKDVKLQGFMLPIVTGERHEHFLLTMRPPHCPFCLSIGPEYIVEVKARSPIKHTFEPIVVSGRFAVLEDDPYGLYYRLTGAQLSSAK